VIPILPTTLWRTPSPGLPRFQASVPVSREKPMGFRTPLLFAGVDNAYIMGDVHINNHTHKVNGSTVTLRRPKVVEHLDQILHELSTHKKESTTENPQESNHADGNITLILNGDIYDLTESWPADVIPINLPPGKMAETTRKVIDSITANNPEVVDRLRKILQHPRVRVEYILGNHERWLSAPEAQEYLRKTLGIEKTPEKLVFSRSYYHPGFQLLAVHGDMFDPYCRPPEPGEPLNDAEKMDLLVIKRLLTSLPKRLSMAGFTPEQQEQTLEIIRSIEYVRPIQKAFSYGLGKLSALSPAIQKMAIEETLRILSENPEASRLQKYFLSKPMRRVLGWAISTRVGAFCLNQSTSWIVQKIRSDKNQLAHAKKLLESTGKEVQLLVLGHTHKILDKTIPYRLNGETRYCRVLNPGSYKATILYPHPDTVYPSGMIHLQKDTAQKNAPVEVDFTLSQKRIIWV
jgi:UDP-2,3-diacylglucosamine pyrophosphatase LpxH